MNDRWAVIAASACFVGALHPRPIPLLAMVVTMGAAIAGRRPLALVLALLVLTSGLAHRSWAGLQYDRDAPTEGRATIVVDPERRGAGHRAVIRLDGRRYVATGWSAVGSALAGLRAGDVAEVRGTLRPYQGPRERRAALHASHALTLEDVEPVAGGPWLFKAANAVRHTIASGVSHFDREREGLFVGLVYGDDRQQDPLVASDFRVAGLTHLLAVSGQNVAYVLAIVAPAIGRLRPAPRVLAFLGVLVLFATITRFEPSVLRASAMAALAVVGRTAGREASTIRLLSWAVVLVLVIDPLLAETLAFRLSVCASAGIALLAEPVERVLLGPRLLRAPLAVTLSAQLGVAPILVSTFGPVSLVTLPANLVAGPAAGLVMMWGMTGGVAAGLTGGPVAEILHRPTEVLLWWLESIARWSATLPLPTVGARWIALAVVAAILAAGLAQFFGRTIAAMAAIPCVVALTATAVTLVGGVQCVGTASLLVADGSGAVLILGPERDVVPLIDDLRRSGIRSVELLVATTPAGVEAAALLESRVGHEELWAPVDRGGAVALQRPLEIAVGPSRLRLIPTSDPPSIRVEPAHCVDETVSSSR